MSLLDDVSIVVTPNGYKAGELYAVVPVPTEGAEVVVNTDFATDTWWTVETPEVQILSNEANFNTSLQNYGIYRNSLLTSNQQYKVVFIINNYTSGAVHLNIGGSVVGSYNDAGTYTVNVSGGGSGVFGIQSDSGGAVLTIDNVSVKEYTAADMDVTRATAATRVDENGLVNYAEIVGEELVVNGSFPVDNDPLWTKGTGWTISGGQAVHTGATGNLSQDIGIGSKTVSLTFDIISIADGVCNIYDVSTATTYASFSTIGTKTLTFQSVSDSIAFRSNSTSVSIDNVSVKEVTRDNVPRIDYSGGGCPHILAEPQSRNLITYSSDFSQSYWGVNNVTVSLSNVLSPNGVDFAYKINGGAGGILSTLYNPSDVRTDSRSIWARTVSGIGDLHLLSHNSNSNNLFSITEEWQRFEVSSYSAIGAVNFYAADFRGSSTLTEVLIWGGQAESLSYPTSLIPTNGSTVTRVQDQFSRDGISSLINSEEGVLFAEISTLANDGTNKAISISDGTTTNRVSIVLGTSNNQIRGMVLSGSTSFDFNTTSYDFLNFNKIAVKYKVNDFALWINGVEVATDSSGNTPVGLNQLTFDLGGILPFYGKVKQLQVFKTALTDSELIALTS